MTAGTGTEIICKRLAQLFTGSRPESKLCTHRIFLFWDTAYPWEPMLLLNIPEYLILTMSFPWPRNGALIKAKSIITPTSRIFSNQYSNPWAFRPKTLIEKFMFSLTRMKNPTPKR
ncbi:hypothetical protein [Gluconobacter cerinus]|uniref:hypothetical protein n=1 Tax=Gluconobacter cerinus TaxID=38307 RepID=UPI001B8D7CC5|nr:hypothetical protein [Gluconobacter cerinus]MBS0981861.1 hypothetical protein [Gluconobacter cerinus]